MEAEDFSKVALLLMYHALHFLVIAGLVTKFKYTM